MKVLAWAWIIMFGSFLVTIGIAWWLFWNDDPDGVQYFWTTWALLNFIVLFVAAIIYVV